MTSERISLELFELPPPLSLGAQWIGILRRWRDRVRERNALAQLSPQILRDIGLA